MMQLSQSQLKNLMASSEGQHLTLYLKNDGTAYQQLKEHLNEARKILLQTYSEEYTTQFLAFFETSFFRQRDNFGEFQTIAIFGKSEFVYFQGMPNQSDNFFVLANSFHLKPLLSWMQDRAQGTLIYCERDKIKMIYANQTEIRTVFDLPSNSSLFEDEPRKTEENISLKPVGLFLWFKLMFESKDQALPNPVIVYGDDEVVDLAVTAINKLKRRYVSKVQRSMQPNLGEGLCWALKTLRNESTKNQLRQKSRYSKQNDTEMVSEDWNEILRALKDKTLVSLMVANDVRVFGRIDEDNSEFKLSLIQKDHEDDDVLDDISQLAIQNGVPTLFYDSSKLPSSKRKLLRGLIQQKSDASGSSEDDKIA
ncbi:MAG: hypothetical protein HRT45_16825 [Bdellovibrionales bacterium]|nr:hypothetical protein [Bdellovibrionales bacterium]